MSDVETKSSSTRVCVYSAWQNFWYVQKHHFVKDETGSVGKPSSLGTLGKLFCSKMIKIKMLIHDLLHTLWTN